MDPVDPYKTHCTSSLASDKATVPGDLSPQASGHLGDNLLRELPNLVLCALLTKPEMEGVHSYLPIAMNGFQDLIWAAH